MYFCSAVWFQDLLCVHVRASSTIPHSQEDEGLSEEERRRMSIEEVRVTDIIRDILVVFEWRSHPFSPRRARVSPSTLTERPCWRPSQNTR